MSHKELPIVPETYVFFRGKCFQNEVHYHYIIQFSILLTPLYVSSILHIKLTLKLTPVKSNLLTCVRYILPQVHWKSAVLALGTRSVSLTTPADLTGTVCALLVPKNSNHNQTLTYPYLNTTRNTLKDVQEAIPHMIRALSPYTAKTALQANDETTFAARYAYMYTLGIRQGLIDGPTLDERSLSAYIDRQHKAPYRLEPVIGLVSARQQAGPPSSLSSPARLASGWPVWWPRVPTDSVLARDP